MFDHFARARVITGMCRVIINNVGSEEGNANQMPVVSDIFVGIVSEGNVYYFVPTIFDSGNSLVDNVGVGMSISRASSGRESNFIVAAYNADEPLFSVFSTTVMIDSRP